LNLRKSLFGFILLIFFFHLGFGQNKDVVLFEKGVNLYKQGKYSVARSTFIKILKNYPDSRLLTATKLMLAKSYYKLQDYRKASIVCDDFIKKHTSSSYLDDTYFLKGEIEFRKGRYVPAIENWLWVVYNESDSRLKKKAGDFIFHTMGNYLSEKEIARLKKKYRDETFIGLVEIVQAQKMVKSGEVEKGIRRLETFVNNHPYHLYARLARDLINRKKGAALFGNRILILKTGIPDNRPISNALAQGFYYAAYEMKTRDPQKNVEIDTLTVDPSVLATLDLTFRALEEKPPLAVIGPLDDDLNASLALLSRYEYFPFISPLNSQNGLAGLSAFTFQINPDAEIKGSFLAEYAFNELGKRTFAILAPADNYGQTMVSSFEQTVESLGGEVVEEQWYYEGTQDFSRQFKAIRKKGFYITFRDSVQQADTTLSEEEIREQFQQYMTEILFSEDRVGKIDSTQIPSVGIDALFIITYPEYIPYIAPQFAFHNIQCTLLGNEGWNDPDQLEQQRAYLDGLIYVTAGYLDPNSWNYKAFTGRFRKQMHTTPQLPHLLGYDIGKWMLSHYEPGITRQQFRDKLENSEAYQGILENIQFGEKLRVNASLNIVKFYMGQLLKIK